MKNFFSFILILLIAMLTLIGCSDDNSTNSAQDFNKLDIPEDFNWTNLDYVQLNISLDKITDIVKNAVVVRYGEKVLATKFLQNGKLEMNINSVKGYNTLIVEVPAYGFTQEISTAIKEHNLIVPTDGGKRISYESNIDPYFQGEISTDTSNYVSITGMDPGMVASFISMNNLFLPTEVPEHNTGWHKYKFNPAGTGQIRKVQDGINNYLLMGTDWIVMQTMKVADFKFYNEHLESRITPNTADISECPLHTYIASNYIFLDENMNFLQHCMNYSGSYADGNRFYVDSNMNSLNDAEYIVLIGQYNGLHGNAILDSWLLTFINSEPTYTDSDGDGVPDAEDSYPYDASIAGWVNIPGGFMMFEDLWPDQGDYDFNDLYIFIDGASVYINSDNKIVSYEVFIKFMKDGANYHNGLGLRFINAVNTGGITTYETIDSGRMLNSVVAYSLPTMYEGDLPNGDYSTMAYIDKFAPNTAIIIHDIGDVDLTQRDGLYLKIYFDPNAEQPVNPIPDFFLFRSDKRQLEIHLAGYPPTTCADMSLFETGDDASLEFPGHWYKTTNNYPWALFFSIDKSVPAVKENVTIFRAYPDFAGWVTSGGTANQDWIDNYVPELTEDPWSD